jgi:hypothetical protein
MIDWNKRDPKLQPPFDAWPRWAIEFDVEIADLIGDLMANEEVDAISNEQAEIEMAAYNRVREIITRMAQKETLENLIANTGTHFAGYWMDETGGVLKPAMKAYLNHLPMTSDQIAAIRGYLRQWIFLPAFRGPQINALRDTIDGLTSREAIDRWLRIAIDSGVDPL